ncbi:peptidoglycan-binding domain-containing protein [Xanthomonas graminis]|uniref:peptidoglycan-binding domain-containing protein n=1 Tax=Xanthomonas graminis TaxID=3390026 RepID=UPI0025425B4E|nr:peptidoglycan-binding protein [Xanthomonas translucens]
MKDAVDLLGIERSKAMTPDVQDKIFSDYLMSQKRPAIREYITGQTGATLHDAQKALSQEWASIANPDTGRSYYPGGANHSSITNTETAQALNAMRESYSKAIQSGLSPDDAWRQINSQPAQQLSAPSHSQRAEPMADGKLEPGERGDAVKQMQGQLAQLGLTGRDGKPLHPDGDFGPNTRYAVEQFQREHGLHVDGVVGRNTRAALDQAVAQHAPTQQTATPQSAAVAAAPLLSDPSHPQHALYSGSVRELEKLGEHGGFANRQALEQAAGQMAFEAKVSGLDRIDHVLPSKDGRGLIAVQGELNDPAMHRVYVDREQAQVQPLQESTRQMAEEVQRQSQTQQGEARAPAAMTR